MTKYCLDTNYILRFLLDDIKEQSLEVEKLLESALIKKSEIYISIIVQMELIYVLSSFYKESKLEIYKIMKKLYDMNFIGFEYKEIMLESIDKYLDHNISIQDSFLLTLSKKNTMELKTFDKKLLVVFKK